MELTRDGGAAERPAVRLSPRWPGYGSDGSSRPREGTPSWAGAGQGRRQYARSTRHAKTRLWPVPGRVRLTGVGCARVGCSEDRGSQRDVPVPRQGSRHAGDGKRVEGKRRGRRLSGMGRWKRKTVGERDDE